jgi:hypothetical protein
MAAHFRRSAIALVAAAMLLAACATPTVYGDLYFRADPETVQIDLWPKESALVIPVRLNGGEPLPFLIDTGATRSALYPLGVAALGDGVAVSGKIPLRSIGSRAVVDTVRVERLRFGATEFSDADLAVLERSEIRPDFAGIIGLDLLGLFSLLFDPEEDGVWLMPSARFKPERFSSWEQMYLIGEDEGPTDAPSPALLFSQARFAFRRLFVLIDTGAESTFISWHAASAEPKISLYRRRLDRALDIEGAVESVETTSRVKVYNMTFGEFDPGPFNAILLDLDPIDQGPAGQVPLMIMGADILLQRPFVIDFSRRLLFFEPAPIEGAEDLRRASPGLSLPVRPQG